MTTPPGALVPGFAEAVVANSDGELHFPAHRNQIIKIFDSFDSLSPIDSTDE